MKIELTNGLTLTGDDPKALYDACVRLGADLRLDGTHWLGDGKVYVIKEMALADVRKAIVASYRTWVEGLNGLSSTDFKSALREGPNSKTMMALIERLGS